MGLDVKHQQKIEYGSLNASLRTLLHVASAFGVTVGRLLTPSRTPPRRRPVGRPPERVPGRRIAAKRSKTDLHFFLVTTQPFHFVAPNRWVIIGLFPISHERQLSQLP